MYINNEVEKLGSKPYAFVPQRNNIILKNIVLNTSGIADLIGSQLDKFFSYQKSKITLNCKKYQSHVWSKILKIEKRSIFDNNEFRTAYFKQLNPNYQGFDYADYRNALIQGFSDMVKDNINLDLILNAIA